MTLLQAEVCSRIRTPAGCRRSADPLGEVCASCGELDRALEICPEDGYACLVKPLEHCPGRMPVAVVSAAGDDCRVRLHKGKKCSGRGISAAVMACHKDRAGAGIRLSGRACEPGVAPVCPDK